MRRSDALGATVLASILATVPGFAQSNVRPVLAVEGLESFSVPFFQVNTSFGFFVLPGRDIVLEENSTGDIGSELPNVSVLVFRGPGTTALYQRIGEALVAARVGVQGDCFGEATLVGEDIFYDWRLTWYGRRGRTNSFRVTSNPSLGLPACPSEVASLVTAIVKSRTEFTTLPTTQRL
jgi:hypothetical protein